MEENVCRVRSVMALRKGQPHTLAPEEHLRLGDEYAVRVDLAAPRYLYIVKRANDRITDIRWPTQGAVLSPAGTEIAIPPSGTWIQQAALAAGEDLCLIASPVRIGGDIGGRGDEDLILTGPKPEQYSDPKTKDGTIEVIALPAS